MLNFLKTLFGGSTSKLSPEDLKRGTIVDVRTPAEYQQGHVAGSLNIPLQTLDQSLDKLRKLDAPIITCCRSGTRSGMATRQLTAEGIAAINGGTWRDVERQL